VCLQEVGVLMKPNSIHGRARPLVTLRFNFCEAYRINEVRHLFTHLILKQAREEKRTAKIEQKQLQTHYVQIHKDKTHFICCQTNMCMHRYKCSLFHGENIAIIQFFRNKFLDIKSRETKQWFISNRIKTKT
jgi:hypothetical protein